MNLLYLNTHDIGRYLNIYGYDVETPNLNQLAKEGMLLRNMHCASPTCSPSRGVLLTGQYPHNNGLIGLAHRGFDITDKKKHLAAFLSQQGYETVLAGVQHEIRSRSESALGYEKVLNPEAYYQKGIRQEEFLTMQDEMAAEVAVLYLKSREKTDRPFYLAVGYGCTHREYPDLPQGYNCSYIMPPKGIPDQAGARQDMARLKIAIERLDRYCGKIIDTLKAIGEYENTVIVFTTDHGLPVPKAKCTLYDDGTGVAMMIKAPGVTKAFQSSDALLSQIDFYPTICELLSLPQPEWLQGVSFLPVLNQTASEVRNAIYGEINYHIACEPVRAVRTSRYKYIRHYLAEYPYQIPCHIDDSEPKEIFHQAGIFDQKLPMEELYDLVGDPQERDNLADCPEFQKQKKEMQNLLLEWQRETRDPLAETGTVCLPEGAIASTPDSYSTKTQVILPECRQYLGALKEILQNNIKG